MRRLVMVASLLMMIVALTACSGKTSSPKGLTKEGIAPYELTEDAKNVLQSFGMEGSAQIISFNAPKEAISLNVKVYCMKDDGKWSSIGGGGISLGTDRKPTDRITGTFAMQLQDNYSIDFHINASGRASYQTEEISLDNEAMASIKGFLQDYQAITINTEIPVALMVYDSGTTMRSYALQDYFEPSKFEGMDMVQVVTLEFSDK